ncbi:MAG: hypothetical protein WA052_01020 [Microgenomates group bacterium]
MDDPEENSTSSENQIESDNRLKFPIEDMRQDGDSVQVFLLTERLKTDEVDLALGKVKRLFGDYSPIETKDLSIKLTDGRVGEGQQIGNGVIEIQLPKDEEAINEMKLALGTALQGVEENEKDAKCREIINATCASTVLHEGVHGLLDSKPGSKFAQAFERISGLENEHGKDSTLLDEGIAYAVQGIFAPEIQPLGSFAPVVREGEREEVVNRKRLGEIIRPKVKEYLDFNKTIDDDFFNFAAQEMLKAELR